MRVIINYYPSDGTLNYERKCLTNFHVEIGFLLFHGILHGIDQRGQL